MSGVLTMSSAAVNAEHEALLEGELSLHCLDFKPASTDEAFHEAAVYVFLGEEHARRLAACWNACHGVRTEHLERSAAPPAAAHGDEASTLVKALSLLWKTTNFLPRGGSLDGRVSAFLAQYAPEPMASAAAMRAQGDAGTDHA